MNWRVKGVTQKMLSSLPGGLTLNTWLQTALGDLRDFEGAIAGKIQDWVQSMKYLSDAGASIKGVHMMEIGTGWFPVLPVCFVLAGADSVATFDIVPHLTAGGMRRLLKALGKHIPLISETAQLSPKSLSERLELLSRATSLKEQLNVGHINYFAPADAGSTGLESNSMDIVYSNSVFEHVPKETIRQLMVESYRVLKSGGVAMHNIGCNDHYAFFDKSISFVNYLQFSEKEWRFWNNSLLYQNRLRAPELLQLLSGAGFEITAHRTNVRPGTLEGLRSIRIAPEFRTFSEEDLVITTSDLVGRKPILNSAPQ
jgi:SAM-dependent methyltransferase